MEFSELIQKRYSVRAYRSDPVEDAKLERVAIEAMYKWRFSPLPVSEGEGHEEEGIVTLRFELK